MNWQEVCEDANLGKLPYKIELNERGQIIMSPVKVYHSALCRKIQSKIDELLKEGEVLPECAVKTRNGTKVANVVWISPKRYEQVKYENECLVAPEICVEVLSPSNTEEEMKEKRELYFEQGAQEVWICNKEGNIRFYEAEQQLKQSKLIPDFPQKIEI